jgi:hypothetical protein
MPANTPFAIVSGPRFTPLRFGLLSAAQFPEGDDPHWRGGAQFQPDACGADRSVAAFCIAGGPATGTPHKLPTTTGAPSTAAEPFTVYAFVDCAPPGWGDNLEDLVARATRQLDSGEGRAVERVFWTGQPDGGPMVFPHLAEDAATMADPGGAMTVELQSAATVLTGTGIDLVGGVAALEGALAECYGGEGVIHIPRDALAILDSKGMLYERGAQIRTLGGNIVAAYSSNNKQGPTGANAAAGSAWLYATGAVVGHRGPVTPTGQRPGEFVGRAKNTTVFLVERTYVFDWDCCHFAIRAGYSTGVSSP